MAEKQKNGGAKSKKNGALQTNGKSLPAPKSSSSFPSLIVCSMVALLSLVAGIWTPSILSHPQVRQLVSSNTTPQVTCDDEALSHFLHLAPVAGMHVVCLEAGNKLHLKVFEGSQVGNFKEVVVADKTWSGLRNALSTTLRLRKADELHQPWALFSSVGVRIADEATAEADGKQAMKELLNSGLVLLFEGGQWIWPGVRVGYKREVDLYSIMPGKPPSIKLPPKKTAILETLSLQPLVFAVNWFLSEEECDHIQEKALPTMRHSTVSFTDADRGKDVEDFRTSSNTFVHATDDMLKEIDYRTASLVRIPRQHQEQAQVLRYGKTQHYVAHHDYFNPAYYAGDPNTLRLVKNGLKNRLATVFWYLSDVEKGGETVFPRWNGAPQPSDFGDCSKGLKVKPQRGKVIIFYSLTPDGELDEYSLHGACPVEEGVKWAANKWVWNMPMSYISDRE